VGPGAGERASGRDARRGAARGVRVAGGRRDAPLSGLCDGHRVPAAGPLAEGVATIPGSSALWISPNAFAELKAAGRATVPFSLSSSFLRDPAASLLKRAFLLSSEASSGPPHLWTRERETDVSLRVDGMEARVRALGARNWFGAYTVLEADGPPLVLSVMPGPASSPGLDLFAPANVLKTLLGYRVSEVTRVPRRDS